MTLFEKGERFPALKADMFENELSTEVFVMKQVMKREGRNRKVHFSDER